MLRRNKNLEFIRLKGGSAPNEGPKCRSCRPKPSTARKTGLLGIPEGRRAMGSWAAGAEFVTWAYFSDNHGPCSPNIQTVAKIVLYSHLSH
ncbi:hypothetical protein PCO31111_04589 [Pandoraea communis]|uniref:Uncharacterized protein n=1 Tax=Pandoraea communis TaxID=2508297 RepID=A0A5E4YL87_9BURK|nr:hypothetical protein PCO31111_04589 [Pandoraea communis]